MAYNLRILGGFGENGQADLPSRGVGAELIEVIEGLGFEGLVGGRVPGDLDGICYLEERETQSGLGTPIFRNS